jgi:hypothetical protein
MEQTFVVARIVFLLRQIEPPTNCLRNGKGNRFKPLTDLVMKSDRLRYLSLERRR